VDCNAIESDIVHCRGAIVNLLHLDMLSGLGVLAFQRIAKDELTYESALPY
jgi:hypothetical protein